MYVRNNPRHFSGSHRWWYNLGEKGGGIVLVQFAGIDAPELAHEENKTQDCLHDQKKAKKARNLIKDILSSAKEVGLIIKEEINEKELRAQVYADGLSVGQELLYKHLAVEGQGKWCEINERD